MSIGGEIDADRVGQGIQYGDAALRRVRLDKATNRPVPAQSPPPCSRCQQS